MLSSVSVMPDGYDGVTGTQEVTEVSSSI